MCCGMRYGEALVSGAMDAGVTYSSPYASPTSEGLPDRVIIWTGDAYFASLLSRL